jgi:hypothetical protein
MSTWQRTLCLGALLSWTLTGTTRGADFNMNLKADDIGLGDYVSGTKLTAADLKGKVIFIEFWGIS